MDSSDGTRCSVDQEPRAGQSEEGSRKKRYVPSEGHLVGPRYQQISLPPALLTWRLSTYCRTGHTIAGMLVPALLPGTCGQINLQANGMDALNDSDNADVTQDRRVYGNNKKMDGYCWRR
ncbi:unnamed protein product [Protopolystoma xenopodis]|uniref:Uncharacterized protein n=1 Tax=Protopolystoma xenopodis TaxID=117903 RepID=A0A3S4ZY11_9PLAT|nr:unnamed protein product [Protopolystoma xenopodis]